DWTKNRGQVKTTTTYDTGTLASTSNVLQHDYFAYPSTYTKRGNPTVLTRWLNTNDTSLSTTNTYNDVGNLVQSTDPGGHTTSFSYADNFYSYTPSQPTSAYVTQVTRPNTESVSHIEKKQYYFYSGTQAASCGENFPSTCAYAPASGQADFTTFTYDLMNRPVTITRGDGGQTTLTYNEAILPISIASTTKIDSTKNLVQTSVYDGLGRLKQTQVNSDQQGTVYTDTTYDALGRKSTVSNPYRSTSEPTYGSTTFQYDALNRVTKVISPEGSSTLNNVSTVYVGNCTTVTDQAGKKRKSCSDALGRLTQVFEPDANNNLVNETDYQYDVLGNLTCVVQKGTDTSPFTTCAAAPASWRPRSFTYNSLSQLLAATNPESGTINYAYNNDGMLTSKTDARGITVNYSPTNSPIDALHRVTKRTYTDGTPAATFTYDQGALWGVTLQNPIGRLVLATSANGTTGTLSSYDAMGRVRDQWQCTPANCGSGTFTAHYDYNLAGGITSQSNPMGFTLTQSYDSAARLAEVSSSWNDAQHPGTLVSVDGAHGYFPHGALQKATLGNGLAETAAYNNRLQPCRMNVNSSGTYFTQCIDAVPGGNVLDLTYGFDWGTADNGNVASWAASGAQVFSRSYTYDELNRLKTMSGTGGSCTGLSWNYDIRGNRTDQNVTGGSCGTSHVTVNTQNRFVGPPYQYDAAGNLTNDGSHTYTYDAENRLTQVDGGGGSYVYDGNGRRVRKSVGNAVTDYIYDVTGNVAAERMATTWTKGYVYFDGQMLAQYDNTLNPTTTLFAHKDHLGSTRLLTKIDKSVYDNLDYLPYGEQIAGDTGTTHKLTGKERDGESGLDNFGERYYTSSMGRFTSPDEPFVDQSASDPQSWNLYSYVRNNPLAFVDPLGTVYCRPGTASERRDGGADRICDVTDEEYDKDSDKFKNQGYSHYDLENQGEEKSESLLEGLGNFYLDGFKSFFAVFGLYEPKNPKEKNDAEQAMFIIGLMSGGGKQGAASALRPLAKMGHAAKHLKDFQTIHPSLTEKEVAQILTYVKENFPGVRQASGKVVHVGEVSIGGRNVTVKVVETSAGNIRTGYPVP
ncbi:MAG: RHS repeat-associated core domain-containing protein, partial [Acidobacteria bacterium]|nr:RHS repeat-associated core domain-containing protein [Acidobacteriota bacterium]